MFNGQQQMFNNQIRSVQTSNNQIRCPEERTAPRKQFVYKQQFGRGTVHTWGNVKSWSNIEWSNIKSVGAILGGATLSGAILSGAIVELLRGPECIRRVRCGVQDTLECSP
jgi:hypothetical protein